MKPTPEQAACVEKFSTGKKLRVSAYAGTGKTSTLIEIAKSTKRSGCYMAFNKAIATEAATRFPKSVSCTTTHGLAFRAIVRSHDAKKMTANINGGYLAARMRYIARDVSPELSVSARGWGTLVMQTIQRWQRSGRDTISTRDVPTDGKIGTLPAPFLNPLKTKLVIDALAAWEQMQDPRSDMPLGHDGYLKLWALRRPTIPGDHILLDEAQDTNGVVMELMRHQQAQVICVGDRHQQIYEWRGAENAMVQLPADLEARLSTSFRFGPEISGYASSILALLGETVPLKGNPARKDALCEIDKPRAILTRTNGRLIEELMGALGRDQRPCVIGGTTELLAYVDATEKLKAGLPVEYPMDFFGFKNWTEVVVAANSEDGGDLQRWVNLVEQYGTDALRDAFSAVIPEARADVILSTGHKSKGREWGEVQLADDFLRGISAKDDDKPVEGGKPKASPDPELRLFYVAATRAELKLDIPDTLTAKIEKLKADAAKKEAA